MKHAESVRPSVYFILLAYAIVLLFLAYGVPRENFIILICGFSLLFMFIAALYAAGADNARKESAGGGSVEVGSTAASPGLSGTGSLIFSRGSDIRLWILAGISLRISLLYSIPALSDDYFRFIWDGMITGNGMNPYAFTPDQMMNHVAEQPLPSIAGYLAFNMNSNEYFSIYPVICQAVFTVSWFIAGENVFWNIVVMRLFILAAESGTLLLMAAIISEYGMESRNMIWYALNPVVILELTGNLHLEAIMIFFFLLSWRLMLSNRFWMSSLMFAIAVHVKLLPLILLPYIFFRMGVKRGFIWCSTIIIISGLLFLPFLSADVTGNLSESLGLYFRTFEFNAGLYYLIRGIGYSLAGYNIIGFAGPALALAGTILILMASYRIAVRGNSSFAVAVLVAFTIYFFCSTTVHPWYIMTIVAFSVFSGHIFPVVWSVFLPLSYHVYVQKPYAESALLVIFTYAIISAAIFYDANLKNFSGLRSFDRHTALPRRAV
jgi:alpha-1,6-mannosyltransferase